jgi:hypothetical protein
MRPRSNQVDGDLRVEHCPELLPDPFFVEGTFDHWRRCSGSRSALAERVGILVRDAQPG